MNNIIVYCETDGGRLCDVSLELMTKARDVPSWCIWRMIHVWSISAHCPMRP